MSKERPVILIILGVTGDLAAKKILPALFNLHQKNALPEKFAIMGFGRKPFSTEMFKEYVIGAVRKKLPLSGISQLESFANRIEYVQGNFDDHTSYETLSKELNVIEKQWHAHSNYVFYLSVPPMVYEPIIRNIKSSSLARENIHMASTRVVVEKPIGKDAQTAHYLETLLSQSFAEQDIYRIDHYLAKEMVQNLLTFRFANDIFERSWNSDAIEKIEIKLWETLGVELRGNFYDEMGALRDVGQNHLLQMLALLTMDRPIDLSAESLHAKRGEVLNKLRVLTAEEIPQHTYRAQYHGYMSIEGVAPDSQTETYFKVRGYIDSERWTGVPIIIESGKRMHEQRKEVIITYKHSDPCLCENQAEHHRNTIKFILEPAEGITISFWSKKPGFNLQQEKRTIDFMLRETGDKPQYIEEYEKLLLDSIMGDRTLFVSTAEVKAMWRFVDPIIEAWMRNEVPLHRYLPDSDEALSSEL